MEIEVVIVLKTKHGLSPKYSVNIKYTAFISTRVLAQRKTLDNGHVYLG